MRRTAVDAYLRRIGADRPERADLENLARLQDRHLRTVPFETIDFNLGIPIRMGEDVVEKIVDRRRGGGCYELNTAFAVLLRGLGYQVDLLPGRTLHNGKEALLGVHGGHMMLKVTIDGEPWLVDVGFRWASRRPLRLAERGPQKDENGEYHIVDGEYGDVVVVHDGVPRVRLETRPRDTYDFEPTLWWFSSAPESPVTGGSVWASIVTDAGRVSLLDRTLSRTEDGEQVREVLDDEAFLAACRRWFGIELDRLPELPPMPDPS
ncbi:arylamine N-acetyltransferase family protein [Streptomyces acidiscabies]|uniref:arylamine N-acetyltransferase family protein n=1 Tax=Streptomyces acidiscabies TaxID=42234 RepID=UPI00095182F5|nr:arylamine N-acetyltransferase [Streptomyces acidiscabies]